MGCEDQTGYSKVYFLFAIKFLIITFLYVIGGGKLISDPTCFAYPAYMSFKAIDTIETLEDDIQWLTYWIVFSFMSFLETYATAIISFVPFYFGFKIMFMIWLYHPKYQGASLVYKQVLRPMFYPYYASSVQSFKRKMLRLRRVFSIYVM